MGEWSSLVTGAPILERALVNFDFHATEVVRMATHRVFFGVVGVASKTTAKPLIYAHETCGTFPQRVLDCDSEISCC